MRAHVPRYLHLPLQVLWFDMEDIALGATLYGVWMMLDCSLIAGFILVLIMWYFMRLKASKPRGYLRHVLYRYGFGAMKHYPSPTTRSFRE